MPTKKHLHLYEEELKRRKGHIVPVTAGDTVGAVTLARIQAVQIAAISALIAATI